MWTETLKTTEISTTLDLAKHTATVVISTETKRFKMTYALDDVAEKLEGLASNPFTLKAAELLGFKLEIENIPC